MNPKSFLSLLLVLTPFLGGSQHVRTVIHDVDLFDGQEVHRDVDIAFMDGRIEAIAPKIESNEEDHQRDGNGRTIIPPLINAHVHAWDPKILKRGLGHGIFAFLDMHNSDRMANMMREFNDSLSFARFYSSNAGATVPNGHGTQFGFEVPVLDEDTGPEEFVKTRIKKGADYIKILREPMFPTIDLEQTARVIEAAHERDRLVIAHISKLSDAMELTRQGVDGFAHIWWDERISEEQSDSLKEAGVFIIPTLSVTEKALERLKGKEHEMKSLSYEEVRAETRKLHEAGIPILAGNDAPNLNLSYSDGLYDEIQRAAECGLSKKEALKAATTNVYKSFELEPFGRLKEGGKASFILIDGDPLEDLSDLKKIELLYRNGFELDPDELLETSVPPDAGTPPPPMDSSSEQKSVGNGELELKIRISGLRSSDGKVLLEFMNEAQEVIAQRAIDIEGETVETKIRGIKKGKYAARVFHDENENGEFDMNASYIPEEGWAYSNNAKGKRGPPPFQDQLFELKESGSIEIGMRYYEE